MQRQTTENISRLKATLSALLKDPDFLPDGGLFGFSLSHAYPVTRGETVLKELVPMLKGEDRMIRDTCSELGLGVSVKSVIRDDKTDHDYRWDLWNVPEEARYPPCIMMDKAEDLASWYQIEDPLVDYFAERNKGTLLHPFDKKYVDNNVREYHRDDPLRSKAVVWISELKEEKGGGYELPFVAYGNEATMKLEYVHLVLIAAFGPTKDRRNWEAYTGVEGMKL
ncbi:hypothetical protein E1B28_003737 [Marasmius oreades]|uniref:Uncharacterized protein n=1 Tax=Marasmius oreades TaxID=181124 RepID=A0A9P7UX84_9AGAR|nr:uncharacterized protein E1B28_003737 [Marasmius oreades]KAG7096290.1 hypothetical protein E1B28_003737 [Marasmius oreades]